MSNHRAAHIRCSECDTVVPNPGGKRLTCSDQCRARRARRLKGEKEKIGDAARKTDAAIEFSGSIGDTLDKMVKKAAEALVVEEVNDKLGETIRAITNLTPRAVARLELDLESPDPRVAQRAAELLLKYSVPVAGKDQDLQGGGNVQINFDLPRPTDVELVDGEPVVELKKCEVCHKRKPHGEFVDGSDRCEKCHAGLRELVEGKFGDEV